MKKGITTIGAMKSRSIFAILGLAAFSVAFGVPESKARPISLIYQVDTPAIKLEAGVQVGSNMKIHSEQFSYENVFAITQIGDNNVADVSQIGVTNVANVYQYGSHG